MPLPFLQTWQFINTIKYTMPKFSYTFSLEFICLNQPLKYTSWWWIIISCYFYKIFFDIYLFDCLGLSCSIQDLCCIMWDLSLRCRLSRCGEQALERRGSVVMLHELSCSMACVIVVSQPGVKPWSSALESKFLTTGPPGKSPKSLLIFFICSS